MNEQKGRRLLLGTMGLTAASLLVDLKPALALPSQEIRSDREITCDDCFSYRSGRLYLPRTASLQKFDDVAFLDWVDTSLSVLKGKIYTFHHESGANIESIARAELALGKISLTIPEINDVLRRRREHPGKEFFSITLDDGYAMQDSTLAVFDRLEKWKVKGTFFVMSYSWNGDGVHSYLTRDQIKEIKIRGHAVGSHTINHPTNLVAMRNRDNKAYISELHGSKLQLQEELGDAVVAFCYPYGVFNQEMVQDLANWYEIAVTTQQSSLHSTDRLLTLGRFSVN